ncbi:MAG: hypothetical protein WD749_02990 [Phycisphaerales bacterium]
MKVRAAAARIRNPAMITRRRDDERTGMNRRTSATEAAAIHTEKRKGPKENTVLEAVESSMVQRTTP